MKWKYILEASDKVYADTEEEAQKEASIDIAKYVLANPSSIIVWTEKEDE